MSPSANTGSIDQSASVLVVGAGPTGLLLASELHRRGVVCHVIEARPAPLPWDRATSPIVVGDANNSLAAGFRLPDTILVHHSDGPLPRLHRFAQRAGHPLLLFVAPSTDASDFADLYAALQEFIVGSPLFDAVFAFSTNPEFPAQTGYLEPTVADRLGLRQTTLLALRPDGYIGLRSDRDHLSALRRYGARIRSGR